MSSRPLCGHQPRLHIRVMCYYVYSEDERIRRTEVRCCSSTHTSWSENFINFSPSHQTLLPHLMRSPWCAAALVMMAAQQSSEDSMTLSSICLWQAFFTFTASPPSFCLTSEPERFRPGSLDTHYERPACIVISLFSPLCLPDHAINK